MNDTLAGASPVDQPVRPLPPERAWLVEWKAHGYGPQWWGFNHEPHARADWCCDANKAIRFSRREDAERMRLHVIAVAGLTGRHDYERSITATEHEWPNLDLSALPSPHRQRKMGCPCQRQAVERTAC
jgi:hypothetical protein